MRHRPSGSAGAPGIERLSRWAAWGVLAVIVYATLSPLHVRPTIEASPVSLERSLAFAALGATFQVGYPGRSARVLALVLAAAFGLEALQVLTPDRHGELDDALVKAAAGLAGCVGGSLAARWLRRGR
jgi:VanZ family protein